MLAYLNGQFVEKAKALISADDRGFLFADGVYEVIRSYNGRLFRLNEHLTRLERSLGEIRINFGDIKMVGEVAQKLIGANNLTHGDALIYVEITRGAAARKHVFPPSGTEPNIYIAPLEFQPKKKQYENGMSVILVPDIRWSRCDIKSVALLPNVMMAQRALDAGADDAIFVRDGVAIEGTASNFFGVFKGAVVTHPKTNLVLAGITREVVLELARKLGLRAEESPVLESQLSAADELFVSSTTMEVTPIVKVDGRNVGDGRPGLITRKLQRAFREYVESIGD
jgi:D-alanine transaminase